MTEIQKILLPGLNIAVCETGKRMPCLVCEVCEVRNGVVVCFVINGSYMMAFNTTTGLNLNRLPQALDKEEYKIFTNVPVAAGQYQIADLLMHKQYTKETVHIAQQYFLVTLTAPKPSREKIVQAGLVLCDSLTKLDSLRLNFKGEFKKLFDAKEKELKDAIEKEEKIERQAELQQLALLEEAEDAPPLSDVQSALFNTFFKPSPPKVEPVKPAEPVE